MAPSDDTIQNLPKTLPLFSLRGAVLLPRAQLPLHIFDSRDLVMISSVIDNHQLIGLVQPIYEAPLDKQESLSLFSAGCAGRIISLNELEEGRLLVMVSGVCRFDITHEIRTDSGYRSAEVNYDRYEGDLVHETDFAIDRVRLLRALKPYFKNLEITPNWDEINRTSNEKLITSLAMLCPFEPREKQALLESPNLKDQSQLITTLIEMASLESGYTGVTCH